MGNYVQGLMDFIKFLILGWTVSGMAAPLVIGPDDELPEEMKEGAVFVARTVGDSSVPDALQLLRTCRTKRLAAELHITGDSDSWRERSNQFTTDLHEGTKGEPATYRAMNLPSDSPQDGLTLGNWRMRQLLGRDCPVIPLWPGQGSTNSSEVVTHRSRGGKALNITSVTRPTMTIVAPENAKADGRAVLIAPGGAYRALAAEHEGTVVAEWLNRQGIIGVILKYRVPREKEAIKHAKGVADIQRAVRILRAEGNIWGVDPEKIGVLGFSAGGHACAVLSAHSDSVFYAPVDKIDGQSARPDFTLLIYPAYLEEQKVLDPMFANLKGTPRMFATIAANDRFAEGLYLFTESAFQASVPIELHVYAQGGHGGGLDPGSYPASEWVNEAERWLRQFE